MSQAAIEWFFALWVCAGMGVSVRSLARAILGRRNVRTHYRMVRPQAMTTQIALMLDDDVRREVLRVLTFGALLVTTAIALWVPNRIGPMPPRSVAQWLALGGLLATPLLLTINSVWDDVSRQRQYQNGSGDDWQEAP